MFEYLKGYLLVYNVKEGVSYFVMLVIIGDYDDCVVFVYLFKFVVEL